MLLVIEKLALISGRSSHVLAKATSRIGFARLGEFLRERRYSSSERGWKASIRLVAVELGFL